MASSESAPKRWTITAVVLLLAGLATAVASLFYGANEVLKNWETLWSTATSSFAPEPGPESYRAVSSEFHVDCNRTSVGTVAYTLPSRAYEVQVFCGYADVANATQQPCSTRRIGDQAVATGTIFGRNLEAGNCPGGGRAKVVVHGTFKRAPAPSLPALLVVLTITLLVSAVIAFCISRVAIRRLRVRERYPAS